jgi:hypothetical protein
MHSECQKSTVMTVCSQGTEERKHVTIINTKVSVTTVRPDITSELPERYLPMQCVLQMASGHTLPILNKAFVKLTLGQRPLTT